MATFDFKAQRIFVNAALRAGDQIEVDRGQANYLLNVLRLKPNDKLYVFNGIDGEWLCEIHPEGRKKCLLNLIEQNRVQTPTGKIEYWFAPLKQARQDYMIQKAVEMGVSALQPVFTQHSQISKINGERMRANAIEAAEQCGVLTLPECLPPSKLETLLAQSDESLPIIFCDECAQQNSPVLQINALKNKPAAVLVGPEGGFSQSEREMLLARENTIAISLGPRILRADTAAVAALALVQSVMGDWYDNSPNFPG